MRRNSNGAAGSFWLLTLGGVLLSGCAVGAGGARATSYPATTQPSLEQRAGARDEFCVKAVTTDSEAADWSAACFARLDREDYDERASAQAERAPVSEDTRDSSPHTTCTRHGDTTACRTSR